MRMSEAKTTHKKVLTLNDIRGVDLSSAPLRVKPTRASYMKNMICKDGVTHKRNGFEQVSVFYDVKGEPMRVNGIFFVNGEEPYTIVHAGASLYKCDNDFSIIKEIALQNGIELADEKSKGFVFKDNLFLLSNGRLLFCDGTQVSAVFDSENAYVPTTSIGITDEEHGSLLEPFEGVNLFSKKRINKLVGSKNGIKRSVTIDEKEVIYEAISESQGIFFLDGEIDFSKDVKINATFYIDGPYAKSNVLNLRADVGEGEDATVHYGHNINTVFEIKGKTESETESETETKTVTGVSTFDYAGKKQTVSNFKEVSGLDEEEYTNFSGQMTVIAQNENGRGKLTFSPALPSYIEGEDNITVEYYTEKEEPQIKEITELSVGAYNKMLAIATEDDVVYFSSLAEGYTYFPDNNYLKVVDNVSALISGEDFLGVASKDEIAVITFSINDDGKKILCVPSLVKKYKDIGCVSSFSQATVEGDTLFLSTKGVYGVSTSGIHLRSSRINKELTAYPRATLEGAFALEHEGRYYLFVDSNVYIADARYKTYESNRLDVSYEYEWWRWEDVPSKTAIVHMGKMFLGRDDGRVMKMSNGYSDKISYELSSNNESLIIDGEIFEFDEALSVNEKDKIVVKNALCSVYELKNTHISMDGGRAQFTNFNYDDYLGLLNRNVLYKGANLTFIGKASYYDETGKLIQSDEEERLDARVTKADDNDFETILIFTEGKEVVLENCTVYAAPNSFFAPRKVKKDDGTIRYELLNQYNEVAQFIDYSNVEITLEREAPVECELHTAVLNFGTDVSKKTLHKIVLVPSADTVGEVSVGFETDKSEREKHQTVIGALSFDNLDFSSFSFDTAFYKTFEKRIHERNVSFVKFKFKSSGEGDFAIENFSCVYSFNSR